MEISNWNVYIISFFFINQLREKKLCHNLCNQLDAADHSIKCLVLRTSVWTRRFGISTSLRVHVITMEHCWAGNISMKNIYDILWIWKLFFFPRWMPAETYLTRIFENSDSFSNILTMLHFSGRKAVFEFWE